MYFLSTFIFFTVLMALQADAKSEKPQREPTQATNFYGQVQLCEGTEALGNEGQGMGASAFINIYTDTSSQLTPQPKKCDLAFAYAFEYGHDRGIKLGNFQSFNMTAISTGKTECFVKEENDEVFITVKKSISQRSKRAPKTLIDNCKMTAVGY